MSDKMGSVTYNITDDKNVTDWKKDSGEKEGKETLLQTPAVPDCTSLKDIGPLNRTSKNSDDTFKGSITSSIQNLKEIRMKPLVSYWY